VWLKSSAVKRFKARLALLLMACLLSPWLQAAEGTGHKHYGTGLLGSGLAGSDTSLSGSSISTFSLDDEPLTPLPLDVYVDAAKQALGQALFFDKRFSTDGQKSCGDCHQLPAIGPTAPVIKRLSAETQGQYQRESALLYNVSSRYWLNWDGRYTKLERLIEESITDTDKFNTSWSAVLARLSDPYQQSFQQAYGVDLSKEGVIDALATFLRSLNTLNSPFDRYLRGDSQALTERQREGYELYKRIGCAACHNGRAIGANFFIEIAIYRHEDGKESEPRLRDLGRYYVTGEEQDRNSFRVPSLRDVALTPPYYHDGSVGTLEEAIEEMAEHQLGIVPSEAQIALLVEFMQSLTGSHPGIQAEGAQP